MKRLSLIALVILAACSTTPDGPVITAATPASVTVWGRWVWCFTCAQPKPVVTDQQITDLASSHCSKYGKLARRAYETRGEKGRAVTFDCVGG